MNQRRSVFLLSLALLLAAAGRGGGGSGSSSTGDLAAGIAGIEFGSSRLVNEERAVNGVAAGLRKDAELDLVAREYSELMRDEGFFSHHSPAGESLKHRLAAAGYTFQRAGENLARVTNADDPAGFAHSLLMDNPGHRANIIDGSFGRLGIGVAAEGNTVWITQIYVEP